MVLTCPRRRFFAGDQQHTSSEEHAQRVSGNSAHVNDHLNGLVCLEYVEGRVTLSRKGALFVREARGQVLEQFAHVIGELPGFTGWDKRELRHWPYVNREAREGRPSLVVQERARYPFAGSRMRELAEQLFPGEDAIRVLEA